MSFQKNFEMLKFACEKLDELTNEVVFVGGATTCLYVDEGSLSVIGALEVLVSGTIFFFFFTIL